MIDIHVETVLNLQMVAQRRLRILDYTQKAFGFFSPTWSFKEEDSFFSKLTKERSDRGKAACIYNNTFAFIFHLVLMPD